MQQNFPADKVDGCTTEKQYHLRDQHQPDKADILALNPRVDNGLCEERKNKLQQAADKQSQYKLSEEALIFDQVFPEEADTVFRGEPVAFLFVK